MRKENANGKESEKNKSKENGFKHLVISRLLSVTNVINETVAFAGRL